MAIFTFSAQQTVIAMGICKTEEDGTRGGRPVSLSGCSAEAVWHRQRFSYGTRTCGGVCSAGFRHISDLEKFFEYLKRSLTIAWKSVFFNFKQYSCFFIAIIIVQILYGLMTVSAQNNNRIEYEHVTEEYDYHMVLKDLNQYQAFYLINDEGTVFKSDIIFKVVRYDENHNYMNNVDTYDVYLYFTRDPHDCEARFRKDYLPDLKAYGNEGKSFSISTTSLLDFEDNIAANNVTFAFVTLILLAVSIFLLMALYNIRINQYKFTYGVYLTFGADFKMLFSTAFWELFVISVVTFVPSVLISTLLSFLIYRTSGYGFTFNPLAIVFVAVFGLVVILCSVWTPMKVMSVKDPMSLIVTEDNSNLVTSPMRSVNIFGEKFPTKYELYSMWRFRKYNIQLLTTAIVFCALFIMGLYMSDIYTTDLEYPRPQFVVDLADSGFPYDDIMSEELYAIDGIRAVEITNNATEARHIASHVMLHHSDVKLFKNLVTYEGTEFDTHDEGYRITNDVLYTAMPEEQIQILSDYDYEGDLSCLTNGSNMVAVGDSISNVRTFKYKVGDKIWIAVKNGQIRSVDSNLTGRALLKSQIQYFHFDYIECTIGAIIYDVPSGSVPVYMSMDLYEQVTGKVPSSSTLNLYVKDGMDNAAVSAVYDEVRDWGRQYGDVKVSNTHITLLNEIARDKHYSELFVCISLLILCISPLVWFFSQTLYYLKREKEFNILQSIGAVFKEIRQIYLQGGMCMAAMSLVVSIVLSYLGSYILFYIYNVIMPYFSGENVRYVFYMPWYAILTSIVVSVFCGFFSTYLPYRSYIKNRYSLQNGGAGGEHGDE